MFEIFRIVAESTPVPHLRDNEPRAALNAKARLPDLQSKLEFTLTSHHHNVRPARRTPCMAQRNAEPHATRLASYGVFVHAGLPERAFGLLLSALPKPPASLRAPSRNAGPARGGSEPQSAGSTLTITTACERC